MVRYIYILLFILQACTSPNKTENGVILWNEDLTTEQNIANNAVIFQDDKSFPFLDNLASTRTVIILGEQGHYDLTTSAIKNQDG